MKSKYLLLWLFLAASPLALSASGKLAQPTLQEQILLNVDSEQQAIDLKAAQIAQELGGGVYSKELQVVVPLYPQLVKEEWKRCKELIAQLIETTTPSAVPVNFENSANSVDMLLDDAGRAAPLFLGIAEQIANHTGSISNFGSNNAFLLKTHASLLRKVQQDQTNLGLSEAQAVAKLADALRGTIIVNDAETIPLVENLITLYANWLGGSAIFNNIWQQERDSGYVGVHAKILLPLPGDNPGTILTELQIHLDEIMDGTDSCVKERAHQLYDQMRSHEGLDREQLNAASRLLFLTALRHYLEEHQ